MAPGMSGGTVEDGLVEAKDFAVLGPDADNHFELTGLRNAMRPNPNCRSGRPAGKLWVPWLLWSVEWSESLLPESLVSVEWSETV